MRWVVLFGPVVASAPMVWGLLAWRSACQGGYDCQPAWVVAVVLVMVVGAVAALLLVVAVAIRKLSARRKWLAVGGPQVVLAVCVAIVLATPVRVGWDDGCNAHSGRVAMVEAPRIWLTEPEGFVLGYSVVQTLVGCP